MGVADNERESPLLSSPRYDIIYQKGRIKAIIHSETFRFRNIWFKSSVNEMGNLFSGATNIRLFVGDAYSGWIS